MADVRAVEGSNVLVTGSNRGLGAGFVEALMEMGAAKVYCGARDPASLASVVERFGARAVAVQLDVTNDDEVARAGEKLLDVDLVVSNAGITYIKPLPQTNLAEARRVMEVNYFGPLKLIYAFGDTLKVRRGGFLYILSFAGLLPARTAELYSASKAAGGMLGWAARAAFGDDVVVSMAYPGYIDSDMGAVFDRLKTAPRVLADRCLQAWRTGEASIFPDRSSTLVRDAILQTPADLFRNPYDLMAQAGTAYVQETQHLIKRD